MKKVDQVVIHVEMTYTAKNKLQELILSNVNPLNHLLVDDAHTANYILEDALDIAHRQCKTRCTPLKWHQSLNYKENGMKYIIGGLVHVEVMYLHQ